MVLSQLIWRNLWLGWLFSCLLWVSFYSVKLNVPLLSIYSTLLRASHKVGFGSRNWQFCGRDKCLLIYSYVYDINSMYHLQWQSMKRDKGTQEGKKERWDIMIKHRRKNLSSNKCLISKLEGRLSSRLSMKVIHLLKNLTKYGTYIQWTIIQP